MQIEKIIAYIALAWLIISLLFIAKSIRRGQALTDTLARRHREKYKAWGEPRPGFLQDVRRDHFARFVAQRKYLELEDAQLAAQFEAYRKDERRLMLIVIATMVIVGGLVLYVQYDDAQAVTHIPDECVASGNLLEQVSCYAAAAKVTKDVSICDRAAHEGVRYQCYAVYAEHAASKEVCHKIPAATDEHRLLRDACLSDVAKVVQDPDICMEIATDGLRDSCFLKLAQELEDQALCARVLDQGLKGACSGEPVTVE